MSTFCLFPLQNDDLAGACSIFNSLLENLTKNDEWKGTAIVWKSTGNETGTRITLTHKGLIPKLECFEICRTGWNYFLQSLKKYLETGKGYPFKNPGAK